MTTIAMEMFLDSMPGELTRLPHAGSGLEHPLVFDLAAREIHQLADAGRAEVVQERQQRINGETLISELSFKRLN